MTAASRSRSWFCHEHRNVVAEVNSVRLPARIQSHVVAAQRLIKKLAHFGIVARQRVGAFEQRFHFKLHAIKHRLARFKTRLAMLGANKAQAGEGWLVITPSPDGSCPRACFFYRGVCHCVR